MGKAAVISYLNATGKTEKKEIAGAEAIYIYSPKSRRKLRRFLSVNEIERAAILGDAPPFVGDVLEKNGVRVCTGERFLLRSAGKLIEKAAALGKGGFCTVYDDIADGETVEIIKYASLYFKNVSICTAENFDRIYDEIMDATGLALTGREYGEVGIVRTGNGGGQRIKIDLTSESKTLFSDALGNIVQPSVAEAVTDGAESKNIFLKIRSLC